MLIPILSVSAIGAFIALRRQTSNVGAGPLMAAGLTGAWAGYLAGWLAGILVDIILIAGFWPVLVGHLAAVGTARLAVHNRNRQAALTPKV